MNLLRTLSLVSALTLISRVLGFGRDLLIAHLFGAQAATDAFVVAFRLPNLLRRLFAEGAFSQAFVPVLAEVRERADRETLHRLIARVFTLLLVSVAAISILGVLAAPWLVKISAPGFAHDAERFELAVEMTRVTFPYILCMALVAFSSALFNTWGYFRLPAATPIALNLSFIFLLGAAALWGEVPAMLLAYAVALGGIAQLLWHYLYLPRLGVFPRWEWAPRDPHVVRIIKLMAPALLGVSAAQVSLLLNTVFASLLAAGSVSWLYYADRLMELPVGLLGAALGVVLLPFLSKAVARKDLAQYQALLDWGLRMTLLLTLPCALGLMLLAEPIVAALFQRGAFTASDTQETARALVAYALGLVPLITIKILAPGFYAQQNTRVPVRFALVSLAVTQGCNLLFLFVLGWAHWALALSISLAAWVNAGLLFRGLYRRGWYRPLPGWRRFTLQVGFANLVLVLLAGMGQGWLSTPENGTVTALLATVGWVSFCGLGYLGALAISGFRWQTMRRPV